MSKADIVSSLAAKCQINKTEAERCLNALIDVVADNLKKTGEFSIVNFVTLKKVHKPATTARNPRTQAIVQVPARYTVRFRAGKGLLDRLNS